MRFVEYGASYFYQSLFEQTHYRSAMFRTFQKVYLNRLYNLLEYYYTHSTSMIVFEIRPKGIRCRAKNHSRLQMICVTHRTTAPIVIM